MSLAAALRAGGSAVRAQSTRAVTLAPHRPAVLRYLYLLRSSRTRLLELIYWPAVQLFVWGFLQFYIPEFDLRPRHRRIHRRRADVGHAVPRQLGFSVSFLEEMCRAIC